MATLIYHPNNNYCIMNLTLWERKVRVKLNTDEETATCCMNTIMDKLQRIERNRKKIAAIVSEEWTEYLGNESVELFTASLYISNILVDIYRDNSVSIWFSVKSRRSYQLAVDRDFELHDDNSLE